MCVCVCACAGSDLEVEAAPVAGRGCCRPHYSGVVERPDEPRDADHRRRVRMREASLVRDRVHDTQVPAGTPKLGTHQVKWKRTRRER